MVSVMRGALLFDHDLSATSSLAGETLGFYLAEADNAVFGSVDGEIAAEIGARAGLFGFTDLANDDLAGVDFLAAKKFDAEALAGRVVDVFG